MGIIPPVAGSSITENYVRGFFCLFSGASLLMGGHTRSVSHVFFSREIAVGGWSGSGSDPGIAGVWSVERECIIGAG